MKTSNDENTSSKLSLLRSEEGSGFIEKIIIIGLFVFVVAGGLRLLAGGANTALQGQADSVGGINTTL